MEKISGFLSKAIDILFLSHPIRTSVGFITGIGVHSALLIFDSLTQSKSTLADSGLDWYHFSMTTLALIYFPVFLKMMFKPSIADENVQKAFDALKSAEREGVNKKKVNDLRLQLCQKVLANSNQEQKREESAPEE